MHAAQHSVTREEMTVQFSQAERITKERFDQLEQRFEQAEQANKERFDKVDQRFSLSEQLTKERFELAEQLNKERFGIAEKFNKEQFNNLNFDIKELSRKHDRLVWTIFAGMLALFFKGIIMNMFI